MEFNRPTNIIPAPWAKNGQYETIPATQVSSGRASWDTGFPVENTIPVSSGGIPANYNDFQGVLHDLSEHTCFQQTGGLYLWSSSIDYPVGAVVQGSDNGIYRALAKNGPNTTVANPVTDNSGKWTSFVMTDGNQTISGELTVTSGISGICTSATNATSASNATSLGGVAASGYVTISGAQTITGAKTFSGGVTSPFYYVGYEGINPLYTSAGVDIHGVRPMDLDNANIHVGSNTITLQGDGGSGSGYIGIAGSTTISGGISADTLTVTSGATISGGIVMQAGDGNEVTTTADNVTLTIAGGADATDAPFLALVGKTKDANGGRFVIHADNGANECNLAGFPDGTLKWGGMIELRSTYPYLDEVRTDWGKGQAVSGTVYEGLHFSDKNEVNGGKVEYRYNTSKASFIHLEALNMTSASATGSTILTVRYRGDGIQEVSPWGNNIINLGSTNDRWKNTYLASNPNVSSDERLKTSISLVPDAVLDAWGEVSWQQFQMRDAVAEKGESARLHNGLVAQRIDAVFKAHGLDASRYGLFCFDSWEATPEERDENGNIMQEARPAGDAYSLRYEEALCMEAAYQRRRSDRAEASISALEQRLAEMEAVLASLIAPISDEQTAEQEEPVIEETPAQENE